MNFIYRCFIALSFIFCTSCLSAAWAGTDIKYPRIGKQCPDFILNKIQDYDKEKISLQELKGKWIFLDFWGEGCISCVTSFPSINAIQKQFKDKIQFFLIGDNKPKNDKSIRRLYSRLRDRFDLRLPVLFDSTLINQFGVVSYPLIIAIDPVGIVRTITFDHLNETIINEFLSGKQPALHRSYLAFDKRPLDKYTYDNRVPFLVNDNGGSDTDFVYRAVLSKWKANQPVIAERSIYDPIRKPGNSYKFEILSAKISDLYRYAYIGRSLWLDPRDTSEYGIYNYTPVLELNNIEKFTTANTLTGEGYYCYSLIVPSEKANKDYLMHAMQDDLKKYFGYAVSIENREMPCLKLIASEEAKKNLKTKGEPVFSDGEHFMNWPTARHMQPLARHKGFVAKNIPVQWLIIALQRATEIEGGGLAIHDETGIKGNIDITIDALDFDLTDIKRALKEVGLDLINGTTQMKVLVIKDAPGSFPAR